MEPNLTIGYLAKSAQVNVETVRYYQRRGLMREPERPTGGVRRYSDDDARRIRFIRRAQQLGFTLEEVTNLLKLEDGRSCRETERLAQQKLDLVDARIADLTRLRKTLRELIGRCESGRGRMACPIIKSLLAEP
jgi:MerR family transcriptional regulator, mercuric resistance operon regulatory protein